MGRPAVKVREEAALFGKAGSLVGVIAEPASARGADAPPAFIFLNAGRTHRVGPNRLYVKLARELAAMGFVTLRFDASGIGDSALLVSPDHATPEADGDSEPQEAMNLLRETRGVGHFVMLGLCSGAGAAFLTALRDPRVLGVVLIGLPPPRDPPELRSRVLMRHFWRIAFASSFRSKKWIKLLRVEYDYRRVARTVWSFCMGSLLPNRRGDSGARSALQELQNHFRCLLERRVRLLVVHAEGDEGLDYTEMLLDQDLREAADGGDLQFEIIEGSNHLFTPRAKQAELIGVVRSWAAELAT